MANSFALDTLRQAILPQKFVRAVVRVRADAIGFWLEGRGAAASALAGKQPARIFRRQRANLIEFLHVATVIRTFHQERDLRPALSPAAR